MSRTALHINSVLFLHATERINKKQAAYIFQDLSIQTNMNIKAVSHIGNYFSIPTSIRLYYLPFWHLFFKFLIHFKNLG